MEYWEAEGCGNRFVVLCDLEGELELSDAQVTRLCEGRGEEPWKADGVIRILRGQEGGDLVMEHRNRDGSHSKMCGNGARVVGRCAHASGLVGERFLLETPSGVREVRVGRSWVSVEMGTAAVGAIAEVEGVSGRQVEIGNPHLVVGVGELGEEELRGVSSANVEYVEVESPRTLRMRVVELGVGETQACGSGASAAAAAHLAELGESSGVVRVEQPGGVVLVSVRPESVVLSGPARIHSQGRLGALGLDQE